LRGGLLLRMRRIESGMEESERRKTAVSLHGSCIATIQFAVEATINKGDGNARNAVEKLGGHSVLDQKTIDEWKLISERTTPGPWNPGHLCDDSHQCNCRYIFSETYCGAVATVNVDNELSIDEGGNGDPPLSEAKANQRFIAAAREAVPRLIAEMERLAARERELVAALEKAREAMEPFNRLAHNFSEVVPDDAGMRVGVSGAGIYLRCQMGDLRSTRAALAAIDEAMGEATAGVEHNAIPEVKR
jgi:hypothetical protein